MNWGEVLGPAALPSLFATGVQLGVPVALAAVGEAFSERTGVLNIGLEGIMLVGAFGSFTGAYYSGNPWIGVICGVLAGVGLAAVMALLSVNLKTKQVINGIAIVLVAEGLTSFLYGQLFAGAKLPPRIRGVPNLAIPGLSRLPGVGTVLFDQNVLVYVSGAIMVGVWWVLYRSRLGLKVRAVGERPAAADAAGISVGGIRWLGLLVGGAMGGLGGAVLIVSQLHLFQDNVTAGRGWVAIAMVILGRWNPLWVFGGALLFGLLDALQLSLQAAGGGLNAPVPFELFQALPYVITLVVMTIAAACGARDAQPAALGIPFRKEAIG
jgi:simple sugar transport system permease protein